MANTPEVDEWLEKTNNLTRAAIHLAAANPVDHDTAAMMRQVMTAATVLIAAMQRLILPTGQAPAPPVEPEAMAARRKSA
jgi:hypothetical protein